MEYWSGSQGQSPTYPTFETLPGRNYSNYSDRHQTTQYPLYYSDQQDQCRESSYWTLPGSRAVTSLPTYANWTDQNIAGHSSSHFPFILNTQPQHQHHMGQYQLHEGRNREWTSVRPSREYDRGFLKEGWQRRWESGSPIHYSNREAPSKRNDNSYRELEAWAARYSHSLPRRRRIEAEMRGASQGFVDSSRAMERDYRSGTDPRLVALQQVIHSNSNVKPPELWTKAGRQKGSIHHPSQTLATDTGNMVNLKDQSNSQRRAFSQPPGYIAPPPYGSPQKSLQMFQGGISEKDIGQQNLRPHNTAKGQNAIESYGNEEKENLKKSDDNQHTFLKTEELQHLKMETETLQETPYFEGMLSLQSPPLLYSTSIQPNKLSPKVIEGRKFRLNKKKGGLTIFCLVSRIADTSEELGSSTYSQRFKSTIKDSATLQSSNIDETHKLADKVDFIVPALREQSNASTGINALNQEGTIGECMQGHLPENYSSNKTDISVVSEENNTNSTMERQVTHSEQSLSVKYPLWKEPSFLIRSETEILSTCPTDEKKEEKTDILNYEAVSTEVASKNKVETLDMQEVSDFEDCKCVPVVDTSCVVVKIEIISSPKKEHVHYFDSTAEPEHSPLNIQMAHSAENGKSSSQLNKDITQEQISENKAAQSSELPKSELTLDPKQKQNMKEETLTKFSIDSIPSFSVSERESLEGRAQRILGIPVDDCFKEKPVQLDNVQTQDAVHLVENEHNPKEAEDGSAEDSARPQEQLSLMHEQNNDLQCDLSIHLLTETSHDPCCGTKRSTPPLESNATTEKISQGLILSNMSSSLLLLSPNAESLGGDMSPSKLSSGKELDPGLMSLNQPQDLTRNHSPRPETISPQLALPPSRTETVQSNLQDLCTSAHTNDSPKDPSPIQFPISSTLKDQDEKGQSMHMRNSKIGDARFHFSKDETDQVASKKIEKFVNGCCMKANYAVSEERAEESNGSQADQMMDKMLEMSQINTSEVNICVNEQHCFCAKEQSLNDKGEIKDSFAEPGKTSLKEKQALPQLQIFPQSSDNHASISQQLEKVKSAAGTVVPSSSPEEIASEVNTLHEKHINNQEDMACAVQTCIPEDHPKDGASKVSSTQLKEPKQNATGSQSHKNMKNWQNSDFDEPIYIPKPTLTSHSDMPLCEFLSLDTDTQETLKDNVNGACPAAITESVHGQDYLVTEETLKLSPSQSLDLSPSIPLLPLVEAEGFHSESTNCLLEEQPQYPQSLWDAVSRIRKHTAPDSENEEEEMSELWDPESAGGDASCPMSAQNLHLNWSSVRKERESWTLEEVADSEELGYVQLLEHEAEDKLSCSSTSSHGSEGTVVIATEEEEVVDTLANCASVSTAHEKEAKEEQCCLSEVKDENAADTDSKCTY